FTLLAFSILVIIGTVTGASAASDSGNWIAAWGTAPTDISITNYENIAPVVGSITCRTVITPTASGSKIRIKFSNYYGEAPLTINSATVAKAKTESIVPDDATSDVLLDTMKVVTFNGGSPSVTIPAGAEWYSDPINFEVDALENIAISFYVKDFSEIRTMGLSGGTSFLSVSEKDQTREKTFNMTQGLDQNISNLISSLIGFDLDIALKYSFVRVVPCLATVDVLSESSSAYSVAVIGDSTVSNEFPLHLAEQINNLGVKDIGVMGKGIIGNMLLHEGLGYIGLVFGESLIDRLTRDVLSQSGIKYVILKVGANDIMHPVCADIQQQYPNLKQPTAKQLIQGFAKVIDACHDAGKKVIVCSITQWKGNTRAYFGTEAKYVRTEEEFQHDWQIAKDVNAWLARTDRHDGFVNLNKISENPIDPDAFLPEYTIDGAHPTDTLQKIWAEAFPLGLIGATDRVGSIYLRPYSVTLNVKTTQKLKAYIKPTNAKNKSVVWYTSNPKVATVNENGVVTAVGNGTAKIGAKTVDGGYKAYCNVKVITPVSGIKITSSTNKVYNTKSIKLTAQVSPSTASNKAVTWSSSNKKIATVSSSGVVTGVGSGTAYIYCKSADGGYTAKYKITVLKKTEVTSIKLNVSEKNLYKGSTCQLTAKVYPTNATFKDVTYSSTNTKVLTVDKNGLVKGVGKGTAYVVCRSADNKAVYARCLFNIKVKTTGVKLSRTSIALYRTKSYTLTPTVLPSDATNKNVTWSSSNPKIASVSSAGVVKALKAGNAVITCKTSNGGYTAVCKVLVKEIVETTKIEFRSDSYSIKSGDSLQLGPKIYPSDATLKDCKWSSSDTSIVKVDSKGLITGVKPGSAKVTVTLLDSGKKDTCTVVVKAVNPTSVKLNATSVSIDPGKTYTLKATISPSNATEKSVYWKSSDTSIATVSSNGVVKGVKPGKVTITCTTRANNKKATCAVTVKPIKISSITLSRSSLTLNYGKSFTLKATISPSNATNKSVKWASSDTKVVTVSSTGKVKAVGTGKAYVTCKPADGGNGKGALCMIEVKK
ncbi:MAG: Ig-like domain-containing protein, partial [Acutalibacteraceae bacterium]